MENILFFLMDNIFKSKFKFLNTYAIIILSGSFNKKKNSYQFLKKHSKMRFLKNKIARATGLPLLTPSLLTPTQKSPEKPSSSPKQTSHSKETSRIGVKT